VISIEEKGYWIWLSCIPEIGVKRFFYLIERFDTAKGVWNASDNDIRNCNNQIGYKAVNNILDRRSSNYLEDAFSIINNGNMSIATLLDEEYPKLLKEIYDPPPVLYYKGNFPHPELPSIAIVGSRMPTSYGVQMAQILSRQLAEAGVVVVSGLARGIDTTAHAAALKAGGHTIGVLGCGVDVIYPPENSRYYTQMAQKGTIVSEYPPGTQPLASNFPARNRIISGLSKGVLVIEARKRSGTLITVDYALEQGRDVYAIPGNINNSCSQGTNQLLKEGAKPVTSVEDILEELNIDIQNANLNREKPLQLDFFEMQVYNALESGQKHIDELVNATGIEIDKLNSILMMLEIKGIIRQLPGKIFIKQ
jgi:DNA processing protein